MWKFIKKLVFTLIILSILGVVAGRFINPPITLTQIGGIVEYGKLQRDYISYGEMGNHVKKAVIAAEDQKFFVHNGFDYDAIQKAYEKNNQGKKLRGGSTISQQTAKNVFLWQGRSWIRKGFAGSKPRPARSSSAPRPPPRSARSGSQASEAGLRC